MPQSFAAMSGLGFERGVQRDGDPREEVVPEGGVVADQARWWRANLKGSPQIVCQD